MKPEQRRNRLKVTMSPASPTRRRAALFDGERSGGAGVSAEPGRDREPRHLLSPDPADRASEAGDRVTAAVECAVGDAQGVGGQRLVRLGSHVQLEFLRARRDARGVSPSALLSVAGRKDLR